MAKIVVAGCSDCPYFAKVELLADKLKINVPNFQVHKVVKNRKEWNTWITELCKSNNWNVKESPIIWRELVDRGGKGHLIGGANEFQEYVRCYYNVISDLTSTQMQDIAEDNIRFKDDEDRENKEFKALSTPMKVCIFGAINDAVPHFVLSLGRGDVISKSTELSIVFLDKTISLTALKGLQMGTFDLAFPLVRSISITDNYEAAFEDSSIVVIFDEMTEYTSDFHNEWMKDSQDYYQYIGNVIEKYCPPDVKVLLVPTTSINFININLFSIHQMLQRIPKFNVVGLARPIEQQVRSVVARKLSVNPSNVHNIIVWGNIGGKMFFDLTNARVHQYDGSVTGPEPFSISVDKTIWDKKWLKDDMDPTILKRFTDISELHDHSGSPLALANAISTFLHQWINGDDYGYIHSLAIASEGWYGVPEGVVFSMPVTLNPKGYWTVVQDIELSELQFKRINECLEEINITITSLYPWINSNNAAELVIEESFIDSQILSMMQEVYPSEQLSAIRILLNESLNLDEKIEISRSKDLLISTIEELQNPKPTKPIIIESNSKPENIRLDPESSDIFDKSIDELPDEVEEPNNNNTDEENNNVNEENEEADENDISENNSIDQFKPDQEDD